MANYIIKLLWDEQASVWVATSDDVAGLVLEAGSLDALVERVKFALPELLVLNGDKNKIIPICFKSERYEQVTV